MRTGRHLEILLLFSGVSFTVYSQAKSGIENYNLLNSYKEYVWMPVIHYQSKNGAYGELRYNYEDRQTISFYGGKAFKGGDALSYTLLPMAGFSLGTFTGVSLAVNADMEWKDFYLSSQTQYSMGTREGTANFLFTWSELGYSITDHFFGGAAVQYTRQAGSAITDPGFVLGLDIKNISVPVYVFNPFTTGRYFVAGLNYRFDFNKKR